MTGVRRVVTGHDEKGHAVIASDRSFEPQPIRAASPLSRSSGRRIAARLITGDKIDGAERASGLTCPDGTVLRIVDMAPGNASPMHKTNSIDYGIVLTGEIEMRLDSGETTRLKPGDIVVQRGTNHAWVNVGGDWARMAFVLVAAKPLGDGRGRDALTERGPSQNRCFRRGLAVGIGKPRMTRRQGRGGSRHEEDIADGDSTDCGWVDRRWLAHGRCARRGGRPDRVALRAFRLSDSTSISPPMPNFYKTQADRVAADLGKGALSIDLRQGMAIASVTNMYDRVMNDVVQVGFVLFNYVEGKFPFAEVAALPNTADTGEHGSKALWRLYQSGALDSEFNEVHRPLMLIVLPQSLRSSQSGAEVAGRSGRTAHRRADPDDPG